MKQSKQANCKKSVLSNITRYGNQIERLCESNKARKWASKKEESIHVRKLGDKESKCL